jgi:hypothetical protein
LQSMRVEDELPSEHVWSLPTIAIVRAIHETAARAAVLAAPTEEGEV